MLFPTFTFAIFFLVVYAAHVVLRGRGTPWKLFMVAASAVFYGWWDWRFLGLIAGSVLGNWALAAIIHRLDQRQPSRQTQSRQTQSKRLLTGIAVALNLGMLGFFKYYGFFSLALLDVMAAEPTAPPLPLLNIVLPVGISFFTFQALSYVLDVSRGKLQPVNLLDVAVFLSFFPQLVAGPIVRASEFLPQLSSQARSDTIVSHEAAWLIGRGLFKKVVISSYLAQTIVDPVFASTAAASRTDLWLAMYSYAIQIYADFSGYTDIAIGLALLLGFRFPQNFDNPYRATSIRDFWRRWHQTLSRWLRDYLYVPLGGSRRGKVLTYRNLMLTMILGGLWHGAAWTFIVWGTIHGVVLATERLLSEIASRRRRPETESTPETQSQSAFQPLQWFVTFHIVCLAWIFFRAGSLNQALDFLAGLIKAPQTGSSIQPSEIVVLVVIIAGALLLQLAPRGLGDGLRSRLSQQHPVGQGAMLGAWLALVVALGPQGVSPFIYFQF